MGFFNLNTDPGMVVLDNWVRTRSYIDGHSASQADVVCFKAINNGPSVHKYPNAYRWYNHVGSCVDEFSLLPGDPGKDYTTYGPVETEVVETALDAQKEGGAAIGEREEENDLFGSDEDEQEEAPEVAAERERRLEEYRSKKEGKIKPPAKSIITLDIKPHGDDTDMEELKKNVLGIQTDGLVWGSSKFLPVGYGIRKLQINLVVEDDKVGTDELEERIVDGLPDYVQSMEVFAMQKL